MSPLITVRDLPPLPENAGALASAYGARDQQVRSEIDEALAFWAGLYLREMGETYDLVQGRDIGIVKALLRTRDIDELKGMMTFFWNHRSEGDGTTLPFFKMVFADLVRDKAETAKRQR